MLQSKKYGIYDKIILFKGFMKTHLKRCHRDSTERLEEYFWFELSSKYQDKFAKKAYDILSGPGTQEMLAVECGVTVRTIQRWKQPKLSDGSKNPYFHEDFAKSYLLGEIAQKAAFDKISIKNLKEPNKHFNPALYFGERKRLHRVPEDRLVKFPELHEAKDFKGKAELLTEKLSNGEITPAEFKKVVSGLHKLHEILEVAPLKEIVQELKEGELEVTPIEEKLEEVKNA